MQSPATWALHFLLQYSTLPRLWLLSWLSTSIGLTRIHKVCSTLLHPHICIYLYTLYSATTSTTSRLEHKQSILALQTTSLRSVTDNGFLHQQAQQEILQTLHINQGKDVRLARRIHTLREGTEHLQAPTHRKRERVPWWCSVQVRFQISLFVPFLGHTHTILSRVILSIYQHDPSSHWRWYLLHYSDKIDTEKPLSAGFYRLEKGTPLVYTYTYHEMKIIVEGSFDISDETGNSVHAVAGVSWSHFKPLSIPKPPISDHEVVWDKVISREGWLGMFANYVFVGCFLLPQGLKDHLQDGGLWTRILCRTESWGCCVEGRCGEYEYFFPRSIFTSTSSVDLRAVIFCFSCSYPIRQILITHSIDDIRAMDLRRDSDTTLSARTKLLDLVRCSTISYSYMGHIWYVLHLYKGFVYFSTREKVYFICPKISCRLYIITRAMSWNYVEVH